MHMHAYHRFAKTYLKIIMTVRTLQNDVDPLTSNSMFKYEMRTSVKRNVVWF